MACLFCTITIIQPLPLQLLVPSPFLSAPRQMLALHSHCSNFCLPLAAGGMVVLRVVGVLLALPLLAIGSLRGGKGHKPSHDYPCFCKPLHMRIVMTRRSKACEHGGIVAQLVSHQRALWEVHSDRHHQVCLAVALVHDHISCLFAGENEALCRPIQTGPRKEVYGFMGGDHTPKWMYYDWWVG
jgi:hypothetical protein